MSGDAPDPLRCPLCAAPNECAIAAGARSCWCFSTQVSEAALARVPPASVGVACVCRACASGKRRPDEVSSAIDALVRNRK